MKTHFNAFRTGITLLECCIVFALVACIIILGISQITFLYKLQVKSEVELLHTTLCSLQQRALTTNTEQMLRFDSANNSYFFNGTTHALPPSIQFGYKDGAQGPPSAPSKPITHACSFVDNTIIFWPDGIIKSGTVYLVDKKKRYAYALSNAIGTVSFLRIYEHKQGTWFCRS